MKWKFYVYALTDGEKIAYIGKGCRSRLAVQKQNRNCSGYELARFKLERNAFAFERQMIAELRPPWNKTKGGDGGRCGMHANRAETAETLIESRIKTAEYLLSKDLTGYLSPSEIEGIRRVRQELLNGART